VWMNPHARDGDLPPTLAMAVAADHIDLLLPADDLAGLERFADEFAALA